MNKLITGLALATAVISVPALATSNATYSTDYPPQSFTGGKAWQHAPDDFVTRLCVTCRQVHLVNPANGEVLREGSDYCGIAPCQ